MIDSLPEAIKLGTVEEDHSLKAKEAVRFDFHLNGYRFSDELIIVPRLSERLIIETATMQK